MRRFLLKLRRRRRLHDDLAEELAFHQDQARRHGNPVPLGSTTRITEASLDLWRFAWIENLWRDVVYAAKGLAHSPTLVASAMLSLGLGIGVNAAMFSLASGLLFSHPSVHAPETLVGVQLGGNSHVERRIFDFVRDSRIFRDMVGENEETLANYDNSVTTRPVFALAGTKNYFTSLGIPVALGRGFEPRDPDEVAVLGYEFWRKEFNGDPTIVNRTIRLEGKPYSVVGVLPATHRTLVGFGFAPDVYIPAYLPDTILAITARLEPGESLAVARERVKAVSERIDATFPSEFKYARTISVEPVGAPAVLRGQIMTIALFFALLLGVVGLVLLMACVNVAGLLLARASTRRRELAIRLAIGASRGRLLQQLLVESALLAMLGAIVALLLAGLAGVVVERLELPVPVPVRLHIDLDWRVGLYAALVTTIALATGLLPAWQTVRDAIAPSLRRERKYRMRRLLVVGQVATSVVVLATSGLFVRNLLAAHAVSPGFDVTRTLRATVNLPTAAYGSSAPIDAFVDRALAATRAVPGIEAVAAARTLPFNSNTHMGMPVTLDSGEQVEMRFAWNAVTPDFFRALGIPIVEGRSFTDNDRAGERPVIVNRAFVSRYLANRRPLGMVLQWGPPEDRLHRIVGVVGNTKTLTVAEDDQPQVYEPFSRIHNDRRTLQFVMRSGLMPAQQLNAVTRAMRAVEPNAGLQVATMYDSIGLAFLPSQIGAALMGSVGLLALLLSAVGLYGVMSYSVVRRLPEIGVRIALGATGGDISRLVVGDAMRLLITGTMLGLIGALLATRPLSMFLVKGLSSTDPLTFALVFAILLTTALAAAWGPVQRASRVDPIRVLRED